MTDQGRVRISGRFVERMEERRRADQGQPRVDKQMGQRSRGWQCLGGSSNRTDVAVQSASGVQQWCWSVYVCTCELS